ncbi:sugar phosphate isomerase/epimerase [Microbacterium deminutum]|uniref:Sugar phosphate isomerase/epimerase n=2 Tax=Microbacterium deminutum TaxID=344164 RepID=A0ABN2QU45_9MICO
MMLKDLFASDGVYPTLARVRAIGYQAVEVSQVPMTPENVAALERSRDELGVQIASLSAAVSAPRGFAGDSLEHDFDKIVADARRLDASHLRIGMLPFAAMESLDTVLAFCARADEFAVRLRDHGIRLAYHNHHLEFTKYDGQYLLDLIAEEAPALDLEVDVHWVQRGGLDPVRMLSTYGERITLVHLKDYRIAPIAPEAFDLLAQGDFAGFMSAFTNTVQFAEVGEGSLDFAAILAECRAQGVRFAFVEQDDLYGRTALDCLQTSYDNLIALGAADLF